MGEGAEAGVAGRVARVTVAIPGGGTPGEVLVEVRGGSETFIAYAAQPVPRGRDVLIVTERGARSVDVVGT